MADVVSVEQPSMTNALSDKQPSMIEELRELWKYRSLLESMVRRDLKVRYKNSLMGFLWSLLNPALMVLAMTYAWRQSTNATIPNMSAYLLAAYLPYMFFSMAIMDATGSVLGNLALVKKIYFPREILPLTAIISNFIHFLLALCVFFLYLLGVYVLHPGVIPFQATTIYLPIILIINLLLVTGLGFLFSAINTFYEDVKYMVSIGTTMLLFLSPIIWFAESMNFTAHKAYVITQLVNPLAVLCTGYRRLLLAPAPYTLPNKTVIDPLPIQWKYIAYTGVLSLAIFFYGYKVFNSKKWKFVERP
jgi:ABC-type polysaccharide/polyol phosphate export permease